MIIETRAFGEVDIDPGKIIHFEKGIIGFPEYCDYALIHDSEQGNNAGIRWMQSIDEPGFALPVMDPLIVAEDYNPEVDDEVLKPIGKIDPEEILVLVTVTVPKDLKKMSVNLRAPIVINVTERKAVQIILEDDSYKVKFPIYDILDSRKKEATC
ncbi:MAG: flagellar assembly protein FliW [Lachnospiraceae bacterium]|nr:flagellar assembly protein FliW [Lachnospiraceae bacterium]MBO4824266.1 flagellar assembly protein FliW [Lachnospiraceae bacterium]MBR5761013.1 flagellar assembly protein FliW [Lachnospiraceae bacterium]